MADARTNLKVRISADLVEFNRAIGGLRSTLGGLKGAFAGALAGVSLTGAVTAVVRATAEAEKVVSQLEARLKSTGGAAGLAKGELIEMASGLQKVTTFGDEAIISAESLLLTFTKIGRDVFPQALESVLNLATGLGTDLNSAAVQVGKALNDPIKGVTALGRAGVQFSTTQKKTIEVLVETGRTAEAQRIILAELETQFGGAARAARNTLGGAFTALKEAAGDLLEGDSASLTGVRNSIESLITTLQDPAVKQGFADIVNGLAQVANFAAKAIPKLIEFNNKLEVGLGLRPNKNGNRQATGLDFFEGSVAAWKALGRGDFAGFRAADARASAGAMQGEVAYFGNVRGSPDFSNVEGTSRSSPGADPYKGLADSAEKATKKAAELRAEKERLRKELERLEEQTKQALDKMRDEEMERETQLQQQLDDAEIELFRATGRAAEAEFLSIDQRWSELLARLKKNSNTEGVAIVESLINVQKLGARLEEFRGKAQEVMAKLQTGEGTLSAQSDAGTLGVVEAETRIRDLRAQSLQQLRDLRTAVAEYYDQTKDPSVLLFLQELDGSIAQVTAAQQRLKQNIEDVASQALGALFSDLATGAKNAKEAFVDFVRSFVQGIAQMISQELALQAVRSVTRAIGFGVNHTGGLAGMGGVIRTIQANPLLMGAAPRYHSGGIAGLAPNEVPAILQRGEEVLTRNDPRHIRNGGGRQGGTSTRVVNVFDPAFVPDQMDSAAGERVIMNVIGKNPGRIKQLLG